MTQSAGKNGRNKSKPLRISWRRESKRCSLPRNTKPTFPRWQKFHSYSFNNSILIYMQKPDASLVAGYKTWQSLERQVKKGEKGILIFAPCPYTSVREKEVIDPETGKVQVDSDGKPVKEKRKISCTYFRPVKRL